MSGFAGITRMEFAFSSHVRQTYRTYGLTLESDLPVTGLSPVPTSVPGSDIQLHFAAVPAGPPKRNCCQSLPFVFGPRCFQEMVRLLFPNLPTADFSTWPMATEPAF